ncbi:hypothetical protein Tsp_01552 [Trichinella spiralis]|uniref:hypothetical protein n=1 Tax=Trichinella spiralis TaxID=6334 RepID=UPI0001EFBE9F|nr:hypothetical protein Tsp_01552 [Trichinella spiralis]
MSSSEIVTVPQSGVEKRVRVRLTEHRRGRTLNQPPYKHMLIYLIRSDSRILRLLVISVCENRFSVKPKYKVAKSEYRDTRNHSITGDKSETLVNIKRTRKIKKVRCTSGQLMTYALYWLC